MINNKKLFKAFQGKYGAPKISNQQFLEILATRLQEKALIETCDDECILIDIV